MSNTKIVLYDIPCKGHCASWSPNVWKTRLVLNYKKLPYTTAWTEHPDLEPRLSALGLPPAPAAGPGPASAYTVPAVQLPDGRAVMDSAAIAPALEALQAEPSLRLDSSPHAAAQQLVGGMARPLLGVIMPRIGRDMLREHTLDFWQAKREKMFGVSMAELERTRGGEAAWAAAAPGLAQLGEFVRAHKTDDGPFVLGSRPSYADFIIVAMLESFRRIGADLFERVVATDDGLRKLHAACAEWLENDQ